jgi:hypothetical protein
MLYNDIYIDMVYTNTGMIVNKISKPISNTNLTPVTSAILAGAGANVILENEKYRTHHPHNIIMITENQKTINLWEFIRLYTIGNIPIIDFLIIYIAIYLINSLYLNYDKKIVLISTIPITILYNIITNKNMKVTTFLVLVLIISIYYLFTI